MESFWGKLKYEWLYRKRFRNRKGACAAIFEYIEIFYNRQRIHASNCYITQKKYYNNAIKKSKAT